MSRTNRAVVTAALLAVAGTGLAACGGSHNVAATKATNPPSPTATATVAPAAAKTCPMTGLAPKHGQQINRVPLAVKIDNVNDARPQAGIDKADLVVEETVEGGLTRLFAVFQCDLPSTIGPIRSARNSDGDLLRLMNHGAVFAYAGANARANAAVTATGNAFMLTFTTYGQYFHRNGARPAPHNVFSSGQELLKAGTSRDSKLRAPAPIFTYGAPKLTGTPAKTVSVTWPAASAGWAWNGHVWQRTQNGSADVLADGHRVSADNVVFMSIHVADTGLRDVLGNPSPDDVVTGSGKVWVLRDGHLIRGTWSRPSRADKMVLKDRDGNILPLHRGNTWIELLPLPRVPHVS